jgi:hypothetical protein
MSGELEAFVRFNACAAKQKGPASRRPFKESAEDQRSLNDQ